jgi:predicted nuclease with RNAse H fold
VPSFEPTSVILEPVASWLGVDVGGRRKGFDVALLEGDEVALLAARLDCAAVVELVDSIRPAVVAIDSPRSCAAPGQTAREGERQVNRLICGIRWTPDETSVHAGGYYAWVVEGLRLYAALRDHEIEVIEVFPTASWTRWHGRRGRQRRSQWTREALAELGLAGVPARTNQDQRDAIAAAVTARQHALGQTEQMGEIVVPVAPGRERPAG